MIYNRLNLNNMITSTSPIQPTIRYSKSTHKDVAKKIEASTRHEAMVMFENAKKRLNDINNWTLFSGKSPADFQLTDAFGNSLNSSAPQIGNLIKVRCHAPTSDSVNKYLWYKIEQFIHEKNLLKDTEDYGFRTIQINNPLMPLNDEGLQAGVTCEFLVTRAGCMVCVLEVETATLSGNESFSTFGKLKHKLSSFFDLINPPERQWRSLVNGVLQY